MGGVFQNSTLTTSVQKMYVVPEAQAFINAAGITNSVQRMAVNELVLDLQSYGIWTKSKALYPIVGGTSAAHAVNLRTPGTYNLTFTGGWVHSSTGALPNGTSDYADTGLVPSTAGLTQNSMHFSYYSRTDNNVGYDMGTKYQTGDPSLSYFSIRNSNNIYSRFNNIGIEDNTSNTNGTGMYMLSRTASTGYSLYKNSSKTTKTIASTGLQSRSVTIGAYYEMTWYYGSKQCAFASIGDGLTDTEAANFYTAVQKFQTLLGRQV